MCLPLAIRYSRDSPTSGVTSTLRLPLVSLPKETCAVDFRDDGELLGLARLEQLRDARQTAGDVLGLGGLARNLRDDVAWLDRRALGHVDIGADRQEVTRDVVASSASFAVLPSRSLIEIRGRTSRSLNSTITLERAPVRSSTRSSIVLPSMISPYLTVPPTSVMIGVVYGSHSAISSPALTLSPSALRSLAP